MAGTFVDVDALTKNKTCNGTGPPYFDSVMKLATLPKLKRIGLVKCANITDESVYALARANQRQRVRRDADGNPIPGEHYSSSSHSSLERVHLSYCTNLTLQVCISTTQAHACTSDVYHRVYCDS